jgi:hypothetical protein
MDILWHDPAMSPVDGDRLVWTGRLTAQVCGTAAALGVVAVTGGLLGGGPAFGILGLVAGVAFVVGASGRIGTLRSERWASAVRPATRPPRVRRGQAVIARNDVMSRGLLAIVLVFAAVSAWGAPGFGFHKPLAWAVVVPIAVALLILGYACRTTVTPSYVVVRHFFVTQTVPRRLIRGLHPTGAGAIAIEVAGEPVVSIATGINAIFIRDPWDYRPAELKTLDRVQAALDTIPAGLPTGFEVVRRPRPATIALAVAGVLPPWAYLAAVILG